MNTSPEINLTMLGKLRRAKRVSMEHLEDHRSTVIDNTDWT